MQVEIGQRPLVDGLEKAEELAMPVAGHAFADRAFELALHPAKTRLIRFGRHAAKQRARGRLA
jgi:hypothetical protein